MKHQRILAVITARAGSKRVPGKNVRMLAGKPLLAWTVEAANACQSLLYTSILSTDDAAIAAIGQQFGANVPFLRPQSLAQDTSTSLAVLQHATAFIESNHGVKIDWVLTLQPTSPLRHADDIRTAIEIASQRSCDSVVAVTEMAVHPIYSKKIDEEGYLYPLVLEEPEGLRRQDINTIAYRRNGAIYLTRRDILMDGSLYGPRIQTLIMPPERSVDIDTELDFQFAQFLLERQ